MAEAIEGYMDEIGTIDGLREDACGLAESRRQEQTDAAAPSSALLAPER
jgi:hypothetical protein